MGGKKGQESLGEQEHLKCAGERGSGNRVGQNLGGNR